MLITDKLLPSNIRLAVVFSLKFTCFDISTYTVLTCFVIIGHIEKNLIFQAQNPYFFLVFLRYFHVFGHIQKIFAPQVQNIAIFWALGFIFSVYAQTGLVKCTHITKTTRQQQLLHRKRRCRKLGVHHHSIPDIF